MLRPDAHQPEVCCAWDGFGPAAISISAIGPKGIARSLAEIGAGLSGYRKGFIVMRYRS
jgi:hypothetical protein